MARLHPLQSFQEKGFCTDKGILLANNAEKLRDITNSKTNALNHIESKNIDNDLFINFLTICASRQLIKYE